MTSSEVRPLGLRERKKAKTRASIQEHALRLYREQGYAQTTVDQIAEAAEVSPSTFFRYFPTKEETVLYDRLDPILMEALAKQPEQLSPIAAVRTTMREVFGQLTAEQLEAEQERQRLVLSVPELRAVMYEQLAWGITMLAEGVAARVGRDPAELAVRTWAGAVTGVVIAAALDGDIPFSVERMDEALAYLESGLPL
jgi:AcrR family transcriptional regulator